MFLISNEHVSKRGLSLIVGTEDIKKLLFVAVSRVQKYLRCNGTINVNADAIFKGIILGVVQTEIPA